MSYLSSNQGFASVVNSTSTPLNAGVSWTGDSELNNYNDVMINCKADSSGYLYADFSTDGINWDSSLTFMVSSGSNEIHSLVKGPRYYRTRFWNSSANNQTYLRLQTQYGQFRQLTSNLNFDVTKDSDASVTRSVLAGKTDSNTYKYVPVTPEGHIEMAIHEPTNPFGSIHVENMVPEFQVEAIYGLNDQLVYATTGLGGTLYEEDSQFVLQTNESVGGNSTIQSKKRLRYRPGQGSVVRFTSVFATGVANSFQVAGLGHPGDGVYFGYSGATFGILYSSFGQREIQTLQITGAATSAGNASITLNGVNFTVPVSNSANGNRIAYEISTGTYNGWFAEPIRSGVVFLANSVGNKTKPFLLSGQSTNIGGTFSKTQSGVALNEIWYPQSTWNVDKMDGTGPSAYNIDPTKGNVYQIGYQFLGYGVINFQVETTADDNNSNFVTCHTVKYPNVNTRPNFRNPAFPFTASAYSFGSTTNLKMKTPCFAGFTEGQKVFLGPQMTFARQVTSVSTSFYPIFTIKNRYSFKQKANQSVIYLLGINASAKNSNNSSPTEIALIKNAALGGNVTFSGYSTNSCVSYDESATSVSFSKNEQLIYSISIPENGQTSANLKEVGIDLQPGESVTLAAKTFAGTAAYVLASLNTREDQ